MRHFCFLLLTFAADFLLPLYAINLPQRYGCDTLMWRGKHSQLLKLERVIVEEMNKEYPLSEKANLYTLMAENKMALGNYLEAKEWLLKGIFACRQMDLEKPENYLTYYTYCECLQQWVKLRVTMGDDSNEVMKDFEAAIRTTAKWVEKAPQHLDDPRTAARVSYQSIQMQLLIAWFGVSARDYTYALDSFEKTLKAVEDGFKRTAKHTMEYAEVLMGMADLYERSENYERALELYQECVAVMQRCVGHCRMLSQPWERCASIYYMLNDLSKAKEEIRKAQKVLEEWGMKEHVLYANALRTDGMICLNSHLSVQATIRMETAYDIYRRCCGERSFLTLLTGVDRAYPYLMTGKTDKAWELAGECLDSGLSGNLSSDHYLNSINLVIDIALIRREYDDVLDLTKDVEEMMSAYPGAIGKFTLRNYYTNVGRAYMGKEQYGKAASYFARSLDIQRGMAHDNFMFLPEKQREQFWMRDESRFNSIFTLCWPNRDALVGEVLYDAALLNKGLLLQSSINLASVVSGSGDASLVERMQQLQLAYKEAGEKGQDLPAEMRLLEQQVMKEARRYGDFMEFTSMTWKDVQRALRPDEVAIEFVSGRHWEGTLIYYAAEVVTPTCKAPIHVPLMLTDLESKQSMLESAPGEYTDYLRSQLWTPALLKWLKPGGKVYFVPAGELYNIGIEYMPMAKREKRMCEVYQMHRLSSTRQLVERKRATDIHQAVLFGGLNYDTSPEEMELYAYASESRGAKSRDFNLIRTSGMQYWSYLPGTKQEVESIDKNLRKQHYDTRLYLGDEGVEEIFKALHRKKMGVIHIATHGFYQSGKGDPLLRSGLVFAGANNFWGKARNAQLDQLEDGILTAREIANLDLRHCPMVVMSACQTGLGDISGEGVFGLQRAFKKAGVQSLLMSLWEVDDQATRTMMTTFYTAIASGASPHEALTQAQTAVRRQQFVKDGKLCPGTDPYFWASFVLMDAF